jgi:uncharacterized protein
MRSSTILWLIGFALLAVAAAPALALAAPPPTPPVAAALAWWVWPLALFLVTFLIGIVAVLAGVGGGVLFVPIVSGLFPFHLDFVRSAGLLLALAGSLSAGPTLLRNGMASLRLALPFALLGSVFSTVGALVSFQVPADVMQAMLGITITLIVLLMWRAGKSESYQGDGGESDRIAGALGLAGVYFDPVAGRDVDWRVQHTVAGFAVFAIIGLVGGMFGLGAGWANVPALNVLLGVPLKGAVATSNIVMSIVNTSAAWIYIERGAVIPMLVVPSLIGVILGARIGARLLHRLHPVVLRRIVIVVLLLAGSRALLKGFGLWD